MKVRINNWDELRDALQRGDYVVMLDAGPMGGYGDEAEVIDYTVGPESYPDQEWLDEEGFTDEEEWYEAYRGTPAIVIDRPMGQGGTNTRILDTVEVSDFEIYSVRAGKYDDEMYENRRVRESSKRGLRENRKLKRKSLYERGMTEYGISRADEIARDNYEREQEASEQKYLVYAKAQAPNRYLSGTFGLRDSYVITWSTLKDLVHTCVNSNDDIEVYETGDDYYFKDEGRIYDILGLICGDDSLNENRKLKDRQRQLREARRRAQISRNRRNLNSRRYR